MRILHLNGRSLLGSADGQLQGDPAKLAQVVFQVAGMKHPPRKLLIGSDAVDFVMPTLEGRIAAPGRFEELTRSTDF
ncbi:hypothetical protein [Stenotrophomonas sp. Sm10]|uniref:hypothetical protein n=1 Tax=Stenotrophomonas sp. Sm10 TaxID=3002754 RepID=UPI0027E3EFD8|nr:hypothetical protein [Stenotrophomonas sp. Sm10]MDQ7310562.1 hypothetical protein [Stenotrophomonas sp. Sm10]